MIKISEVRKFYGDGKHNAFTDLVKWKNSYYLGFRHASSHVSMDGVLYVFSSAALEKWEKAGEISLSGKDLRDPKFLPMQDKLLVYTPVRDENERQEMFCSYDGRKWTGLKTAEPNLTYWRPRFREGKWYVAGYHYAGENQSADWFVDLLVSDDGEKWKKRSRIYSGDSANETELWFYPDGKLLAAVRREKDPGEICLAVAESPYERWEKYETGIGLQGPAIGQIGSNLYLLGRHWKDWECPRTLTFFEIADSKNLAEKINLPAGKHWDFSYAAFLPLSNGETLISYYSGHEETVPDATSIFLARVRHNRIPAEER